MQNKKQYFQTESNPLVINAWELIKRSDVITLLSHYNPDPDGLAACAALEHIFLKMNKSVEVIVPSAPKLILYRKPLNLLINQHQQIPHLIISCDTASYDRLYYPEVFQDIPFINIDHHASNVLKGIINIVDQEATSTCDLLYGIIRSWGEEYIDIFVAECLLYGLLYDSQIFQTQSTTIQALHTAASLMEKGASLFQSIQALTVNKNKEIIHFWGELLQQISFNKQETVAWSIVRQRDLHKRDLSLTSLVGFENFIAQLSDIDITMLLYEDDQGKTKVSLRSKKSDVNVIAKQFGGGGHKFAAGILSSLPIDVLVKKILEQCP